MHTDITLIATAAFGLEACVKRELKALGFGGISVSDGSISFSAELSDIARANIWLRCADRVFLKLGEFKAETFDALFEGVKALPWVDILPIDANIHVLGKSVRSKLFSVSDCQSISKKAIIEKMKARHNISIFPEDGDEYKIQIALLNDTATICLDTSGAGLHKRGYRLAGVMAPLRETLAAGLIDLSYFRPGRVLLDPCCGSGTIPIEAAMIAAGVAPGAGRGFIAESYGFIPQDSWANARAEAAAKAKPDACQTIFASDIDRKATDAAKNNAIRADVKRLIRFETAPLSEISLPAEYGVLIANPPYGDRLATRTQAEGLYSQLGSLRKREWSANIITSDEYFESAYGKRADSKRKLYNGMIKTDYYQYRGERPRHP